MFTIKPDYSTYHLQKKEAIFYGILYLFILCVVSILFYNSLLPFFVFFPFIFIYYKYLAQYLCKKRKTALLLQFRDMLYAISSALSSGYSLENAFLETYKEMLLLYGQQSDICAELQIIHQKLNLNIPIEIIFSDFALRSGCEDIRMFSEILTIAKRQGGNLINIIRSSSETIREKIDIQREIKTILSSRKYEQNFMSLMPILIMTYLRITSNGFFDVLYHNLIGIVFMTAALVVYLSAIILGIKLADISI